MKNGTPKYNLFSPNGHHNTWMRTWPFQKWQWNGLLRLVKIYLTCAALLYAAWGGSHMVCKISLVLTGDFKVSITNQMEDARKTMGRELEEMRQSIDQTQMCHDC
jgi:hypothetical protein